jgi:hypothetical protein
MYPCFAICNGAACSECSSLILSSLVRWVTVDMCYFIITNHVSHSKSQFPPQTAKTWGSFQNAPIFSWVEGKGSLSFPYIPLVAHCRESVLSWRTGIIKFSKHGLHERSGIVHWDAAVLVTYFFWLSQPVSGKSEIEKMALWFPVYLCLYAKYCA